jgi:MFS family permease
MAPTDSTIPATLAPAEPVDPAGRLADARPVPRVGKGFIAAYAFALFGVWMLVMTPATVSLALRVNQIDPDGATGSYSLIAGVGALVAMLANPFFGRLSDVTTSRWGMRRPWIVVGVVGGTAAAVVLATADSIGGLFFGWALMQFTVNAAVAALIAVIADQVPAEQQGLMSGIAGMTPTAGILAGTYFVQLTPDNTWVIFLVPALVACVSVAVFAAVLRDRRLSAADREPFGVRALVGSFYTDPRKAPDFSWFLVAMFFIAACLAVIQTYLFFFVQDHLGIAEDRVPTLVFYAVLVMNLLALAVSPLSGVLSDRIGRRKPVFAVAGLALAAGALVMLVSPSLATFFTGVAIAGVGYGIFSGLYIAMATQTMTDPSTSARDLGLVNIAYTLPYSLVPLAAPALLALAGGDNYVALFVAAAAIALVGIAALVKVRIR